MAVGQEQSHGHASNEGRAALARGTFAVPGHRQLGVMYLVFALAAAVVGILLGARTRQLFIAVLALVWLINLAWAWSR